MSITRSTSPGTTSIVTDPSLGVGSGSTSGVDDVTDAVLVMPSPAPTTVVSIVTHPPHHLSTSPSSQVTVWPSTSHGSPVCPL